jgi:hypothetical protein
MKKPMTMVAALALIVCTSCTSMMQRTMKIEGPSRDARVTLTIDTTLRSYFDPDGFSREYHPRVAIRVFGEGKNMSYRNNPGTTFKFGKDFDVDIDYCSGGFLWISEDASTLGVALFDVRAPATLQPLKDFNGSYPLTKTEADWFLKKK